MRFSVIYELGNIDSICINHNRANRHYGLSVYAGIRVLLQLYQRTVLHIKRKHSSGCLCSYYSNKSAVECNYIIRGIYKVYTKYGPQL